MEGPTTPYTMDVNGRRQQEQGTTRRPLAAPSVNLLGSRTRCMPRWPGRQLLPVEHRATDPVQAQRNWTAAMDPDDPALLKDRLRLYQLHEGFSLARRSVT